MEKRAIEMFIGVGSDSGTWSTEYVYIPMDTPESEIEQKAKEVCKNSFTDENFQFCGVYSIPELTDEINTNYYYHIHVIGKHGFSTCLCSTIEHDEDNDWDDILNEAVQENYIDKEDINYVDTIEEIDKEEYEERFK